MINRRRFLGTTIMGGAGLAAASTGCTPGSETDTESEGADPATTPFELDETTVAALQESMESGQRTARSITELYLGRIDELDRQGPGLGSIIETNPQALEIADQFDAERGSGTTRGPLHGIPVIIKDNIDTADQMTTTAGSLALEGSIPAQDSSVAQKLREAGAIILAKANLSEWANFRSTMSSSGWSGRGGQCRNPYALDRNPCGSSSGSGVAIAANLGALAIGTETDGSIVCPSTRNGIVGVKPTVGLVSRAGIIPISHIQDTAGPMVRTVRDGAVLLGALTGVDPRDDATAASEGNSYDDYTQFLEAGGLRDARIGVARNFPGFDARVVALFDEAVTAMAAGGATIVDPADVPNMDKYGDSEFEAMMYEFKASLNAYLEGLGPAAPVKRLAEIIAFNEENRDRSMPFFGQEILVDSEAKGPLTDQAYRDALANNRRYSRREGIDALMDEHNLDAIIAPTGNPAWMTDHVNGDQATGFSSRPAAVAGYPDITVPMGFVAGLPVGISFFGRAWSEPTLLKIAYAFEQATNHREAPRFLSALG